MKCRCNGKKIITGRNLADTGWNYADCPDCNGTGKQPEPKGANPMNREKREVISPDETFSGIEFNKLVVAFDKLQEERDKAVELLKEIVSVEKYIIKKVSILGAIVSLAKDFLNQLEGKG